MTCNDLADWVNDTLQLEGNDKYHEGEFLMWEVALQ